VLRLYLIFAADALRSTAMVAGAALVLSVTLARLGIEGVLDMATSQAPILGFVFLFPRYTNKNLGWMLGLPQRKRTLAWFNFGLNASILAMVVGATALVVAATHAARPPDPRAPRVFLDPARLLELGDLHGPWLATRTLVWTACLFLCWISSRPVGPIAFGPRQRAILTLWAASALLFGAFVHGRIPGLSLMVLFALCMMAICTGIPYATGKALGTSLRQRRAWALVGAVIAVVEIGAVVIVNANDLCSPDPNVSGPARHFFGAVDPGP
jgi:hypothetical protein